jgi:hypothetical protein
MQLVWGYSVSSRIALALFFGAVLPLRFLSGMAD